MILSKPIWSSTTKTYTINITGNDTLSYSEIRDASGNDFFNEPDTIKKEFQKIFIELVKEFTEFLKDIFSTPIKDTIFIKRSKHVFNQLPKTNNYGKRCLFTWTPIKIIISSTSYEIYWDINIVVLDDTIECELIKSETTNIIEANEDLNEISDISPEQHIENSSRALLKKKVREARLKVAIAKIKAEKLAAKYFRRYGNDLDVSYESDLSSDSDE